jgi:hypothetical protein
MLCLRSSFIHPKDIDNIEIFYEISDILTQREAKYNTIEYGIWLTISTVIMRNVTMTWSYSFTPLQGTGRSDPFQHGTSRCIS